MAFRENCKFFEKKLSLEGCQQVKCRTPLSFEGWNKVLNCESSKLNKATDYDFTLLGIEKNLKTLTDLF